MSARGREGVEKNEDQFLRHHSEKEYSSRSSRRGSEQMNGFCV